ncbi:MAG: hypothetical protein KUG82_13265 [Pseudomonadales bacterium]|nr:hypothetical protein [Pseudomonadales bacterium]
MMKFDITSQRFWRYGKVLLLTCMLVLAGNCQAEGKGIMIIANPSVSEVVVSARDMRLIYFGKMKKWQNGTRVKPAQIKSGALPEIFSLEYMKKPYRKYKLYWRRVIAAGTGIPPRSFASQKLMLEYVRNTKGAIGYVDNLTDKNGIVVLQVID